MHSIAIQENSQFNKQLAVITYGNKAKQYLILQITIFYNYIQYYFGNKSNQRGPRNFGYDIGLNIAIICLLMQTTWYPQKQTLCFSGKVFQFFSCFWQFKGSFQNGKAIYSKKYVTQFQ